jgi:hypothetical protein
MRRRKKPTVEALSLPALKTMLEAAMERGDCWVSLNPEAPWKRKVVKISDFLRLVEKEEETIRMRESEEEE